jgi:hypothetical protein
MRQKIFGIKQIMKSLHMVYFILCFLCKYINSNNKIIQHLKNICIFCILQCKHFAVVTK